MKRWIKYAKPYLPFFFASPICMMVEVIGDVYMPKLLAGVINSANAGTLTTEASLRTMVLMILTALAMMLGGSGGSYFSSKASVNFATDLRADVYAKTQKFSFSNIDKFSTGSLVTRLTNDITQMENFINTLTRSVFRAPVMMVAGLVMAISLRPSLSVVFAVSIPMVLICIGTIIKVAFPRFSFLQKRIDGLNSTVQENVTNVRVVKSFVRESYETEKFQVSNSELKDAGMSAMKVMILMQPLMTLIMNATVLAVILIGGPIVLDLGMEVGDLSAFITYATQILSSLQMVTMLLMNSSRALASGRRISEVLDETVDLSDENAACPERRVEQGGIEFRNVSFRYNKSLPDKVLDDISFRIPGGATVGIIGSTGCGKSTLVSMIPRLYDCDEGEVLVDGINIKDYSLRNLRDGVSMVLQVNTLFSGSIAENLRWGDENASDEEVVEAAEYAQAEKFVRGFKDGYETTIHQGGSNVSGGQKQRLCIARALLKKPKVLILDDSTSAVDTATEAQIRRAFREKFDGVTKLIIAQRITSVMEADMIIVMDAGKITGIGTHEELLENSIEYREIYDSQTGKVG